MGTACLIRLLLIAHFFVAGVPEAFAQAYPDKPISILVPFAAGSDLDAVARTTARYLGQEINVPVVVDNRGGGNGAIGVNYAAAAPADGYKLLVSYVDTLQIKDKYASGEKLDRAKVDSLESVAILARAPMALVVNADLPVRTIEEFLASRRNGRQIIFGSPGEGSAQLFVVRALEKLSGSAWLIPYFRGSRDMLEALKSKNIDAAIVPMSVALRETDPRSFRVIAVTGKRRNEQMPMVRTIAESYPAFDGDRLIGLFAPAKVDRNVIALLRDRVSKVTANAQFRNELRAAGADVSGEGTQLLDDRRRPNKAAECAPPQDCQCPNQPIGVCASGCC